MELPQSGGEGFWMEEWILVLCLVYIFGVGYLFARGADGFMHARPRGFPGRRKKMMGNPAPWRDPAEDGMDLPLAKQQGERKHEERNP